MGFLNDMLKKAESSGMASSLLNSGMHSGLVEHFLSQESGDGNGELSEVIDKLKAGGLGGEVESWISSGPNQPITASEIESALGSEHIQQLAAKFGIPAGEVSSHLAQILPTLIDKLHPAA